MGQIERMIAQHTKEIVQLAAQIERQRRMIEQQQAEIARLEQRNRLLSQKAG